MLIGEVARRSGISARMLRHYDRIGLLRPSQRSSNGYRRYAPADVERLFRVEGLRSLGLSLKEIARALDDPDFSPTGLVRELIERAHQSIATQERFLERLQHLQDSSPTDWTEALSTVALMRGLENPDPSERVRLALSMTDADDRHAGTLSTTYLDEADTNAAGALLWALVRSGDDAVPALTQALTSDQPGHRRRAVEALRKIDSPAARAGLAAAHPHTDPVVHSAAALARAREGDQEAIGALIALVTAGQGADVDAADALATLATQHGHAAEVAASIGAAINTGSPAQRIRLTAALAENPSEEASGLLTTLLADPDHRVVLTASSVLRDRTSPRS